MVRGEHGPFMEVAVYLVEKELNPVPDLVTTHRHQEVVAAVLDQQIKLWCALWTPAYVSLSLL